MGLSTSLLFVLAHWHGKVLKLPCVSYWRVYQQAQKWWLRESNPWPRPHEVHKAPVRVTAAGSHWCSRPVYHPALQRTPWWGWYDCISGRRWAHSEDGIIIMILAEVSELVEWPYELCQRKGAFVGCEVLLSKFWLTQIGFCPAWYYSSASITERLLTWLFLCSSWSSVPRAHGHNHIIILSNADRLLFRVTVSSLMQWADL